MQKPTYPWKHATRMSRLNELILLYVFEILVMLLNEWEIY